MEKFWENPKFQCQLINDDDLCSKCRKRPRIKSEQGDGTSDGPSLCSTCRGADHTWEKKYEDGFRIKSKKGKVGGNG